MIFVIDSNYLVLSALVTIVWQTSFSIYAIFSKTDKVTDLSYGSNFVVLVLLSFFLSEVYFVRQIIVTIMVTIWGLRLAGFLFYRILKIGKDERFNEIRDSPIKFLIWFFLQFVSIWLICSPQVILNANQRNPPIMAIDIIGWIIWCIGFLCESISDQQKFIFRSNPENKNRWCDEGLWHFSRHPNYFGEIACWWGLFLSCSTILSGWTWFCVIGPIYLTVLLMFGSGVPTTERSSDKRFGHNPDYIDYKRTTPILIPFFPGIFMKGAKILFCCEFPQYNYLEPTHRFGSN